MLAFILGLSALTRPPRATISRTLVSGKTLTMRILLTVMFVPSLAAMAHGVLTCPTIPPPTQLQPRATAKRAPMILLERAFPRLSFFENVALTAPMLRSFTLRIPFFTEGFSLRRMELTTDIALDSALVGYLDELSFKGMSAKDGSKLVAGLKYFLPSPSRTGPASLPTAFRALTVWRKTAPTAERPPLPLACAAARVGTISYSRDPETGRRWMLLLATHMLPGEVDNLKVKNIVSPLRTAGLRHRHLGILLHRHENLPVKAGLHDEAILLDRSPELEGVLAALTTGRPPTQRLLKATGSVSLQAFFETVELLNLTALKPTRYGLCHGGASEVRLGRKRSLAEIKLRGRWASDTLLKMHSQKTRPMSELVKLDSRIIKYGRENQQDISASLLGVRRPHPPPLVPSLARSRKLL